MLTAKQVSDTLEAAGIDLGTIENILLSLFPSLSQEGKSFEERTRKQRAMMAQKMVENGVDKALADALAIALLAIRT